MQGGYYDKVCTSQKSYSSPFCLGGEVYQFCAPGISQPMFTSGACVKDHITCSIGMMYADSICSGFIWYSNACSGKEEYNNNK